VRVDFEPWNNFCFCECENGHYSRETGKNCCCNEHTSMTERDIASVVGVGKSSVSRILCSYKESGLLSPNRKGKCERKRKTTPRTDQLLLRNSRLHPTVTSKDLRRNLLTSGIDTGASTVGRSFLIGRKARKPIKKQLLRPAMKQKRLAWANKYRSWSTDDWKKVAFSDETHFLIQGYRANIRRESQ
jgi:DNA-directed RNA polymerase I, II, and III subunit RPABC1